jgi:hypothetical protein
MGTILEKLQGFKTITSAIIIAIVAILKYVQIIDDATAKLVFEFAAAIGLYGVYDKVRRSADE